MQLPRKAINKKLFFSSSQEELRKINVLTVSFSIRFFWGGIKKKCTIIIHGQATTEIISIDHHLTCF